VSAWLDRKYIDLSSSGLRNFKWKSPSLANCSCPLCGDSIKNKLKARFYFFEKNDSFNVYCHNCNASFSFSSFLKDFNIVLYGEYNKEKFFENATNSEIRKREFNINENSLKIPAISFSDSRISNLKKISQLKLNHKARIYVEKRKIPSYYHYKLYYAPKFKQWVNEIIPDKFDATFDEPRLVIPFFDKNKKMYAFQGRSLDNSEPKYYSIVIDTSYPKIYGLDKINFNKQYYIVEGPLDSLFLPNCLAMSGSHFDIGLKNIKENAVIIYDNQPRNKEICTNMQNCLKNGMKIVIWPDNILFKDINEMIMNNISAETILDIIKNNTFSSMEAELRLKQWVKIK
jgi:hypothetical protein